MDFSQFEATLTKNQLSFVYYLTGEEHFLVARALRKIDETAERIKDSFSGRETYDAEQSWGEAMASLYTDSMFGEFKTVVVQDFDKLLSLAGTSEKTGSQLRKILDNPPNSSILILIVPKLDKRTKVAKMLASETVEVDCRPLKPYQMEKWILKRVKASRLRMSEKAFSLFVRRIGGTLEDLEHELEKLTLFQPEGPEISEEEIHVLVEDRSEEPIYLLYSALDSGDSKRSYETMKDLLEKVDSPIQIVAGLSRHVSELLNFVSMTGQGLRDDAIQRRLGVSSYKLKQLNEGARNFDKDRLTQMLCLLESIDERLKTGSREGADLLYHMIAIV